MSALRPAREEAQNSAVKVSELRREHKNRPDLGVAQLSLSLCPPPSPGPPPHARAGGPEDRSLPLLLPLVPRAHLQGQGSISGPELGAGGTRGVPGAPERDAPRGLCPDVQLPGKSKGSVKMSGTVPASTSGFSLLKEFFRDANQ